MKWIIGIDSNVIELSRFKAVALLLIGGSGTHKLPITLRATHLGEQQQKYNDVFIFHEYVFN
jgi:hypothetical protein